MVQEDTGNGKYPSNDAKIYIDGKFSGETSKDGRLEMNNVPPGRHILSVKKPGFPDTQKDIFLNENLHETIEIKKNQTPWQGGNNPTIWEVIWSWKTMRIVSLSLPGPLCIFGLVLLLRSRAGSYKAVMVIQNRRCQIRLRLLAANDMGGMAIYVGSSSFAGFQKAIYKVLQNPVLGRESFENEITVHDALKGKGIHATHLVSYLGSGFLEQGKRPVIIFEYLKEKSIREIIRSKKYTLKQAIRLGIGLCEPIQAIHNAGYCRLDLKPAHLILRGPYRFTLIDVATALTIGSQNRMLYETANYTPKEAHDPHIVIDQRSDIYSLGKIFEELFEKFIEGPEVNNHRAAHIQTIQAVIIKMTRENRSERHESISEVVNELQALL